MAEEENIVENEQSESELRQMIIELNERLKTVEKDNRNLRAENRKYFYDSLNTGLEPKPEAEPEAPKKTELSETEMQNNFEKIIKGAY